jgi:hypothetical protein
VKRFQTVGDLAAALEPLGSPKARELARRVAAVLGAKTGSTPVPAVSRRRTWVIAAAAALVGIVIATLSLFMRR